ENALEDQEARVLNAVRAFESPDPQVSSDESRTTLEKVLEPSGLFNGAPSERGEARVSGTSQLGRQTPLQVGAGLLKASQLALKSLEVHNILRPKLSSGKVFYELVHDGFGRPLTRWAEERRRGTADTLSATTAHRGTEFNWERLADDVVDVSWVG